MKLAELASQAKSGPELSREEIELACGLLLDESNSVEDRAGFLSALHYRGETPAEVAALIELLALGKSGFVSGQVIPISGAWC